MDMTGSQISHYQIEERLGEGGMGVVYRALDTKLGRKVALKFLPAFVSQKEEEKARFLHEARTTSGLDHPNIATIYEVNEADDKIFYAMQLVEGVTLKDLRRQGPVTNKQIIQLATQVADGLAHAHDRDVVHRDIKPQNIMVTREGRAIILDFGLAMLLTQESVSGETSTAGTAAYISPEQAQGDPATPQSDLFSLGVVLYELVAGQPPFLGDHPAALVYSIVHEDPPSHPPD
jgi:serine/threonine protein kinase